ncbi:ABC transporter ATP-binding protein [Paenibacillus anaericanus]|uniref:ABC transporter ATP-binding protein n=1 Tax=Paenibacillus anaericanus TaxID=170367 RepID=A0A433Y8J1_9BACL|nr:ABC transporter ATP-binding protein [Paenibacillus anaericanus]RUT46205.1 ABC transporter ATP-binding protein [Paenibacillus anaericanus]
MDNMQIEISNLNKFYGKKHALQNINLSIGQGMFGLLGRNGAGKTTLMKTLATLLNKKSGDITVCGIPIQNAKEICRITGYLPQEFSMYPSMKVYEAMDYLGVLSGLDCKTRKGRIPGLLEKVNLGDHHRTKVKALSGGMKRRLGIAQAILHDPKVLIVDEPTAGLDPEERIRFRNLLCELAEERIVILSTHIVGDIEATCEDIAIMDNGKLLYKGTVKELTRTATNKVYTAEIARIELNALKEKYIVTGMLTMGERVNVRLLANEQPTTNAILCEPNIEDAYMLRMHESGVAAHQLGGNL